MMPWHIYRENMAPEIVPGLYMYIKWFKDLIKTHLMPHSQVHYPKLTADKIQLRAL